MAYRVRILPTAEAELDQIVSWHAEKGPQTARSFMAELRRQIGLISSGTIDYGLSTLPEVARLGYHSCLVKYYVMLYVIDGDELVIAHIFHQRQDYGKLC